MKTWPQMTPPECRNASENGKRKVALAVSTFSGVSDNARTHGAKILFQDFLNRCLVHTMSPRVAPEPPKEAEALTRFMIGDRMTGRQGMKLPSWHFIETGDFEPPNARQLRASRQRWRALFSFCYNPRSVGALAQLVEQRTLNPSVVCSSHTRPTNQINK